uniref:Proteoglycan 4 n=1 Tax=Phallusia mammillata TaxID=59560 RepID=A0A6F9DBR1_9ASCI|nr:proteoglycan 4 [Phallusia mammillata]
MNDNGEDSSQNNDFTILQKQIEVHKMPDPSTVKTLNVHRNVAETLGNTEDSANNPPKLVKTSKNEDTDIINKMSEKHIYGQISQATTIDGSSEILEECKCSDLKIVANKLSETQTKIASKKSSNVSQTNTVPAVESLERDEEEFKVKSVFCLKEIKVKSVQSENKVEQSKKNKIHPIFSNVLVSAMRKQNNHFPIVYIGAPNICDMRAYVKQQSEQKKEAMKDDFKVKENYKMNSLSTTTNSHLQVLKINSKERNDEDLKTINAATSTATNTDNLQKVLDSLQHVESSNATKDQFTVISDNGWKDIANCNFPPSMVKVTQNISRKPAIEAINYINQKNNLQQRRRTVGLFMKQNSSSKLQYSFKPTTTTTSLSSPVSSSKPAHVTIKKSRLMGPNQVISVPLTLSSKSILHITPSQTGITMSAKATKLSTPDPIKVTDTKTVETVKPCVAKSVAVITKSIADAKSSVAVTQKGVVVSGANFVVKGNNASLPLKNVTVTSTVSAIGKPTCTIAANAKRFSVKLINPANSISTKLHNGVVKVFSNIPKNNFGSPRVTKVNHELKKQLQTGIKRKGEENKGTAKKICISEKDTNIQTENKISPATKEEFKPGSKFKGRPGALVRFEDGLEMWVDKMRDVTFVDDEPIKSWALKPGTEVAAKFSDGLFYDAVVVRSFSGTNNHKTEISKDKKEIVKTNPPPADSNAKAQVKHSETNKKIETNDEMKPALNKNPQVQVEKLKIKVPAVVVVNNKKTENKSEEKTLSTNVKKPSLGQKWMKCPNCFLVFIKVATYQLHQQTVCGQKACMVEDDSFEQDKEVQVDESSVPPIVLQSKEWREKGGKQLYTAGDRKRWFKRGTRFLHRWQTDSGKSKWYNGMVRSLVGNNPKHPKCEFEVEYTDDDHDNGPYAIALYEDFPHDIRIVVR